MVIVYIPDLHKSAQAVIRKFQMAHGWGSRMFFPEHLGSRNQVQNDSGSRIQNRIMEFKYFLT
jgi:hypothetical protein